MYFKKWIIYDIKLNFKTEQKLDLKKSNKILFEMYYSRKAIFIFTQLGFTYQYVHLT